MKRLRQFIGEADFTGSGPDDSGTAAGYQPYQTSPQAAGMTTTGMDMPSGEATVDESYDIGHPAYNETEKHPRYNVPVSPITAHFQDAGKMLKARMPELSKDDHLRIGDEHAKVSGRFKAASYEHHNDGLADLKRRGVTREGLVNKDDFDGKRKDTIRELNHSDHLHKSAAMAHYGAARLSHSSATDRYRDQLDEDVQDPRLDTYPLNDVMSAGPYL